MFRKWKKGVSILLTVSTLAAGMGAVPAGSSADTETAPAYRNVALRRAVYQSSAANFEDTGHLITDGIRSQTDIWEPVIHAFNEENSPSAEKPDRAFDGNSATKWLVFSKTKDPFSAEEPAWLQITFPAKEQHTAASYTITSANDSPNRDPKSWVVQGSNDGETFVDLDRQTNQSFSARFQPKTYPIAQPAAYHYYRLCITESNGDVGSDGNTNPRIQLSEWDLLDAQGNTLVRRETGDKDEFKSLWRSKGSQAEWVYVDLGAKSVIDKAVLSWNRDGFATAYDIQVSDDAKNWETVYTTEVGAGGEETCTFDAVSATYVRLLCKKTDFDVYALSEMEVFGTNDLSYSLPAMPAPEADGTQQLTGGNWTLQRASEVDATGEQLASDYDDAAWLPATVPGTVLTSYLNAGAIPDPNVADQQLLISDSFFTTNWWYRNHFVIPETQKGKRTWLNFDAINWKADVYFNGENIGKIEGAFIRGQFDITDLVHYGGENYLAVYIHKNDTPGEVTLQDINSAGKNGGVLGADNPTIHASIGWDWVPTIRGRNVGIYEDVFLSYSDDVTLSDPWAITDLDVENKDFSKADVTVKTIVNNPSDKAVTATVKGRITPGDLPFESEPVTLAAGASQEITVDTVTIQNPQLWWPNTYGDQPLYTASLTAEVDGEVSDSRSFTFGVRKFTYDTERPMTIYCNGTRIVCRGGNWGMDDSNLAATPEDYDIKVRLHAEANLTMIRNWVGMTNHKAFYDACDKYGILIWDDFWLANPGDGPNPNDEEMFMDNVRDKITRNRSHASLALYCGRNEGNPTATLDAGFREETARLDGTRHYISHSAYHPNFDIDCGVSGWGPYSVQNPKWYFQNTGNTLHSERGMPNIPSYESMMAMLTEEYAWPINDVWGIHDFCGTSAQGANGFQNYMKSHYGEYDSLEEFVRIAQMVNYENHKAMFEAMYPNHSNGILMWMSQSAWPSMVWQTYDYYYDTNAGYFGIKKGNQPVNAILNQNTNEIVLSNATPNDLEGVKATLSVYDLNGQRIHHSSRVVSLASDTTTVWKALPTIAGATDIQFVRTTLTDAQGNELADNFTWVNTADSLNYKALNNLADVKLTTTKATFTQEGGTVTGKVTLKNDSETPALMIRLKTTNDAGERVLPVYYDDNYISLMPGESRTITLEFDRKYLNDGQPSLAVEGWNITPAAVESNELAPAYTLGDVDNDGDVDVIDALIALQEASGKINLTEPQKKAANVDTDDQVTASDALLILKKATKQIQQFPREKS